MRVNQEQIQQAKSVDLIEFLEFNYPDKIEYSNRKKAYIHPDHDSLIIDSHLWHRFSTNEGGDQIEYLVKFCGLKFQAAVVALCEFPCDKLNAKHKRSKAAKRSVSNKEKESNYYVPIQNGNSDNVKEYLQSRCIPLDTIEKLVSQDLLYEDIDGNCVFCRRDPGLYILRGTRGSKWIKILTEVPNNYWFFKIGENPENIYICEAPLDAISLYECNGRRDGVYCAMAGLKPKTYDRILDDFAFDENGRFNKNIKFGVDWDEKGIQFLDSGVTSVFPFIAIRPPEAEKAVTKDWNDVLILRTEKVVRCV